MIPMKHSTIFKNRYWALLWAAGIIWFAVDTAGAGNSSGTDNASENATGVTDATGAPVDDQQLKQFESALNGI